MDICMISIIRFVLSLTGINPDSVKVVASEDKAPVASVDWRK